MTIPFGFLLEQVEALLIEQYRRVDGIMGKVDVKWFLRLGLFFHKGVSPFCHSINIFRIRILELAWPLVSGFPVMNIEAMVCRAAPGKVPLPEMCRGVSLLLQNLRNGGFLFGKGGYMCRRDHLPVGLRLLNRPGSGYVQLGRALSCQKTGPAGSAHRGRCIGIGKYHPFGGKLLQVGSPVIVTSRFTVSLV